MRMQNSLFLNCQVSTVLILGGGRVRIHGITKFFHHDHQIVSFSDVIVIMRGKV